MASNAPTGSRSSLEGVSPDELAGLSEIIETLGVTKRTALKYVTREDFPEPIDRLATGRVWLRADVVRWGKAHLPLPPGRPRKSAD
jgi:predicted DNA-binding transcriptional regulator AlpA